MSKIWPARFGSRLLGIVLSTVVVLSGLTVVSAAPALAAEGSVLVSGTVSVDANKNNVLDTTGPAGEVDRGVAGIAVTLHCVDPQVTTNPGWRTVTDADGHWSFPETTPWADECNDDQLVAELSTSGLAGDVYAVHIGTSSDNQFAAVPSEMGCDNGGRQSLTGS